MSDLGNKEIMAKNIRYYMKVFNVTQTEICNTLGIKMPTFSDWVNAKTYPRIDKIELMANYFGIPKSDLVEDRSRSSKEYYLNEETAAIAQEIFEKDKILFDVYRSTDKDRLISYAKKLQALRDMEEGRI